MWYTGIMEEKLESDLDICDNCGKTSTQINYDGRCPDCRYGTTLSRTNAAYPALPKSDTLEAAKSVIPLLAGDLSAERKAHYLGFRYTGFSVREAIELTGIHTKTLYRWRKDTQFYDLECEAAGPARAEIRKEVMHLLFVRNMHLKLMKDFEVLKRANKLDKFDDGSPMPLDPGDRDYLNKIAGYYSPQQLETIERIHSGDSTQPWEFGDFVRGLQITRTEKITMIEERD
jgi:hypothetical protein